MNKYLYAVCATALTASFAFSSASAGPGKKEHGHGSDATLGSGGDLSEARRALRVTMTDNRYSPKSFTVSKGETVRFIVENKGEFVHEFNIGTAEMHMGHRGEMMAMMQSGALTADRIDHSKMTGMKHDDPNSILLEPGQKGEVVWKFGTSGEIQFACNVPGHYEDGMVGNFKVR